VLVDRQSRLRSGSKNGQDTSDSCAWKTLKTLLITWNKRISYQHGDYKVLRKATRSFFSCSDNQVPSMRLKSSTVSSRSAADRHAGRVARSFVAGGAMACSVEYHFAAEFQYRRFRMIQPSKTSSLGSGGKSRISRNSVMSCTWPRDPEMLTC
jgi:hypothetical protein